MTRRNPQQPGFFQALFDTTFNQMITMRFLQGAYLVIIAVAGLYVLFRAAVGPGTPVETIFSLIIGVVAWLVFVTLVRVALEAVAVLFRISENTTRMADALERRTGQ